MSNMQVKGLL